MLLLFYLEIIEPVPAFAADEPGVIGIGQIVVRISESFAVACDRHDFAAFRIGEFYLKVITLFRQKLRFEERRFVSAGFAVPVSVMPDVDPFIEQHDFIMFAVFRFAFGAFADFTGDDDQGCHAVIETHC